MLGVFVVSVVLIEPSFITFSTIPTRSALSVQYCFSEAWTAVVGKAVTIVAKASKPVANRFNIFFIAFKILLSFGYRKSRPFLNGWK